MAASPELAVFVAAALVLLVVPGPAVLFVVARSLEGGMRAGVVSTLGLSAGAGVHVLAAALGLSALLVRSALAFSVVRYAGAAYLVWLGIRAFRDAGAEAERAGDPPRARTSSLFVEGFVVNALNPKTALFFLAFLPQFVDPAGGPAALQLLGLGGIFVGLALVTDLTWAAVAARAGAVVSPSRRARSLRRRLSGAVYLGLRAYAALSGGRR